MELWCVHAGAEWHMSHKQSAPQWWRPVKEEQAQQAEKRKVAGSDCAAYSQE